MGQGPRKVKVPCSHRASGAVREIEAGHQVWHELVVHILKVHLHSTTENCTLHTLVCLTQCKVQTY